MVKRTEKDTFGGLIAPNTTEISKTMNSTDMEPTHTLMVASIKVSGATEESTAKESLLGLMDDSTMDPMKMM